MVGLSILGGLVDKVLPAATNLIDELHTSGEEKAAAKQKLKELLVSAEADAQKKVAGNRTMDLLKELEGVRAERENKQVPDGISDTEQKHDMGEPGKTSPVGSK